MTPVQSQRHAELSAEGLATMGARNDCDREPIHLSAAVQPHGFLLAVDAESKLVTASSTNFAQFVRCDVEPLGRPLDDVVGAEVGRTIADLHISANPHDGLPVRVTLPVDAGPGSAEFDMVAHRRGPVVLLEFEPADAADGTASARFFQHQRNTMKALLTVNDVEQICELTAHEVRKLTGFDRVMIYRFEPDAHGQVVAEACAEDAQPMLGLHFPAGDIPRQARALYLRSWIRVIGDVEYAPAPIVALASGIPVDQLDLSMSVLRSVSPVHLQYLKNMGVRATMTISLIVDNQLWGLIACHHDTPKPVDHMQRLACEALGQLVSVRLRAAELTEDIERVRLLGRSAAQVVTAMAAGENPAAGAAAASGPLLEMTGADGAVVQIDGVRVAVGSVPGPDVVDLLVSQLAPLAGGGSTPVVTDSLMDLPPGAALSGDISAATGAMYLALPGRAEGFIVWLRGERGQTVRWAGRPDVKIDDAPQTRGQLSPRTSFAEWLEQVHGHCLPWSPAELAAASELAQAMPEVLLHRAQNRLVRLALHDPLTGLPNRVLLHDRLDDLLSVGRSAGPADTREGDLRVGVLFVDIDGFKTVNDTQGHLAGDELLTLVARRITSVIRRQDTVARMGGDEFVVLLPSSSMSDVASVGQRIVEDCRRSFVVGGEVRRSLTLSVGAAIVSAGTAPAEALRQADAAMYHAKRSGRNQVAVYDPASGTAASRQLLAGQELCSALDAGEITVHYQPIFKLVEDGAPALDGFEALARWLHPTRGLVPPDEFIGLAEDTGQIDRLGDSVMRQALHQLQRWSDRQLSMAVNVSVRQLVRPGFSDEVLSLLLELGVTPTRLCVEVTESQVMEQPQLALATLHELEDADVRISIDDFGTGHSSLAYVRDLPASLLKIDRSFVGGLPTSRKDSAVVAACIQLAHSLGMETVAEGVETAEQLAHLCTLGCDFAQGYLLGRPEPAPF